MSLVVFQFNACASRPHRPFGDGFADAQGLIADYLRHQNKHECAGEWEQANRLNCWLPGAVMTVQDLMEERWPLMRRSFVARARGETTHDRDVDVDLCLIAPAGRIIARLRLEVLDRRCSREPRFCETIL